MDTFETNAIVRSRIFSKCIFQNYLSVVWRYPLKADFHSVEFSDWTGNPLFTCENVALNLNRMLRLTNVLLCQIQSARKILLSGNQP